MQDTKIKLQKQTHGKIDQEHTPSYNSIEDNKISRNKPNQECERPLR